MADFRWRGAKKKKKITYEIEIHCGRRNITSQPKVI